MAVARTLAVLLVALPSLAWADDDVPVLKALAPADFRLGPIGNPDQFPLPQLEIAPPTSAGAETRMGLVPGELGVGNAAFEIGAEEGALAGALRNPLLSPGVTVDPTVVNGLGGALGGLPGVGLPALDPDDLPALPELPDPADLGL